MAFRLKSLRTGCGPVGADFEVKSGERETLNPLFVVLRDRRALLDPAHGRGRHLPYVVESIKTIRDELTSTLRQLGPDSSARPWVEQLRSACREFLTAVESWPQDDDATAHFAPALAQLRAAFLEVANHVAAYYRLPAARELADEMVARPLAATHRRTRPCVDDSLRVKRVAYMPSRA